MFLGSVVDSLNLTASHAPLGQLTWRQNIAFRKGLLSEAIESLLSGEVALGKELLRDYIDATVGFAKLAAHAKAHVKTPHQTFGANGNPTANNLFEIVAYVQNAEGVRFEVRCTSAALRTKRRPPPRGAKRTASAALSH